jgi:Kae1-associated kinase Bud32
MKRSDSMRLIKKGAEADIYETEQGILKRRVSKSYRAKELDESLRKHRTRVEARILQKAKASGAKVPELLKHGENISDIVMEKVDGKLAKDVLSKSNYAQIAQQSAKQVALLHSIDVIHGDLTTSNIIFHNGQITIIDFGLSKQSKKVEDKAVDLHVFEETLESTHPEIAKPIFAEFLKEYQKQYGQSKEVLQRLETIQSRGRYKHK